MDISAPGWLRISLTSETSWSWMTPPRMNHYIHGWPNPCDWTLQNMCGSVQEERTWLITNVKCTGTHCSKNTIPGSPSDIWSRILKQWTKKNRGSYCSRGWVGGWKVQTVESLSFVLFCTTVRLIIMYTGMGSCFIQSFVTIIYRNILYIFVFVSSPDKFTIPDYLPFLSWQAISLFHSTKQKLSIETCSTRGEKHVTNESSRLLCYTVPKTKRNLIKKPLNGNA